MTPDLMQRAREIGFNHQVDIAGRALQVQTEVTGFRELMIKTTIMEGGIVRVTESQPCPDDALTIEVVRALVEDQHRRGVEMCKRGEVG